jgi:ribosomal protein S18 acetylase RimI-like enzyme
MTMILRRRESADVATIVGWVPDRDALHQFSGTSLDWPLTESQLSALDEIDGRTAWVLVHGTNPNAPVGHADLTLSGTVCRIGRVIVAPDRRGHHLGSMLMALMLEKARDLGASRADLYVLEGNMPALRIYERLGFTEKQRSDHPGMVAMAMDLPAS